MFISVEQLNFEYFGYRALKDVSFGLEAGSITALVGPNGAGKTTLLRCLAGLEKPLSGKITIDGVDVLERPRLCHRKVGYLSAFFELYERLTIRQSLYFVARSQGIAPQDCPGAIDTAARRLQIEDRLDVMPAQLSRGLRQRVAIAQAIIHGPKVVMLDEPASGLDSEARHTLAELLLELRRQGMTLLISSHNLAELEGYSTDMLILQEGRIVEQLVFGRKRGRNTLLRLRMAAPVAGLYQRLRAIGGISNVCAEHDEVYLQFAGDEHDQHRLLMTLLEKNIPVCAFNPVESSLHDA